MKLFGQVHRTFCLAMIIFLAVLGLPGCNPSSAAKPNAPGRQPGLAAATKTLFQEAAIGTDEAFDKYKQDRRLVAAFVAPQGFRLLQSPPEIVIGDRIHLGFRWDKGRIAMTWQGRLGVLGNRIDANAKLRAKMKQLGYDDAADKLTTHLAADLKKKTDELSAQQKKFHLRRENLDWPLTFARATENVREEIFVESLSRGGPTGRGYGVELCAGDFEWCVACDYSGAPPSLKELLAAIPALNPVYIEPALLKRLRGEPAYRFKTEVSQHLPRENCPNMGWQVQTSASLRSDVEAVLKTEGFVPQVDRVSHGKQFDWKRSSDYTFVHIIPSVDETGRIRVFCQLPQRPIKP